MVNCSSCSIYLKKSSDETHFRWLKFYKTSLVGPIKDTESRNDIESNTKDITFLTAKQLNT